MSRRHQSRLFERQNRVRLDALACVQDYLEGIKDMRACRAVGKDSAAMEQAMLELKRVTMRVELARRRLRLPRERHPPLGSRFDRLRRGGASRLRRRGLHGSAHVLAHRLPRLRAHPRPRLAAAQPSQPLDEDRPHQGGHGRARSEGVRLGGCARPRPVLPGRPVRVRRRRGAPRRKLRRARGGSHRARRAERLGQVEPAPSWRPNSGSPTAAGSSALERTSPSSPRNRGSRTSP